MLLGCRDKGDRKSGNRIFLFKLSVSFLDWRLGNMQQVNCPTNFQLKPHRKSTPKGASNQNGVEQRSCMVPQHIFLPLEEIIPRDRDTWIEFGWAKATLMASSGAHQVDIFFTTRLLGFVLNSAKTSVPVLLIFPPVWSLPRKGNSIRTLAITNRVCSNGPRKP